jgi:penicillin-binding protein 1A
MTAAFVPFANGGHPVVPYAVTRILTRDGRVVYERNGSGFPQAVADFDLGAMNQMMKAVVTRGTGTKAAFPGFEIAGKTGTSQDYRDAWFVGYTSELVAGVWVGNDDNSPTRKVTGGSIPAEIWQDVMEPAHAGLAPRPLPGEVIGNQPPAVSQAEQVKVSRRPVEEPEPRMQNEGFFESIGGLFGKTEKPPKKTQGNAGKKPEKKQLTLQERVRQGLE